VTLGQRLPEVYGAPLRLRVENQLGYKMVKWIERIGFIESENSSVSEKAEGTRTTNTLTCSLISEESKIANDKLRGERVSVMNSLPSAPTAPTTVARSKKA